MNTLRTIARIVSLGGMLSISITVIAAPDYQQTVLEWVYPAGGQRGTTVQVELGGAKGTLKGATGIVVDGPPGITVSDVKADAKGVLRATFRIAADAVPGRRMVRARGGVTGLTNFRLFFVGPIPEYVEAKDNNTPKTAEEIQLPVVVNGRVNPVLDQDCFRFNARKGQKLVAAVLCHWLDAIGYDRANMGFADASLEVLNAQGRVVAQAGDTLGFDPLVQFTVPDDGDYTVRVSGMGYKGFPQMVYRLTVGEVPYPTAIFPAGGKRGETIEIQFSGPNVPPGTRRKIKISNDSFPVQYVSVAGEFGGVSEVPLIRDDLPQRPQLERIAAREKAVSIVPPLTINGRFDALGDDDWFRLPLAAKQQVTLEIMAQRHLRAPVDTLLEVYDSAGKSVAANDDGALFGGECTHDFFAFDSRLEFTAKTAGDYFVRVSEQTGAIGARAVYRLSVFDTVPDFRLFQWPDAVPIWGPGSSTGFPVESHRLGGLKEDIELIVEGLPKGWTGSVIAASNNDYRSPVKSFGQKSLLTITAPTNATPGALAEFRVVGRCRVGEREIIHEAQCLTHYMWQEPNRFRYSPIARAAIAQQHPFRLLAEAREITAKPGGTVEIPIRIEATGEKALDSLRVSVNRARAHFVCSVGPQISLKGIGSFHKVGLTLPADYKPGVYSILVSDAWSSELRKGLPGPCTPLIRLIVKE